MFEMELNKRIKEFKNRANHPSWKNERCIDGLYCEYYEERTYWVYNYEKDIIYMVKAGNPKEAVEKVK